VGPSLTEVTVELVADRGFAGVALSGIAEHAGITKAAVLYHFPSKIAVVRAAHDHVLSASGGHVAAVEAEEAPAAYVRAVIGYLRDHPRHTRMITEALTHDDEGYEPADRWGPSAEILDAARRARGARAELDTRTLAIIGGGSTGSSPNGSPIRTTTRPRRGAVGGSARHRAGPLTASVAIVLRP
jgi:AcrR family transcriptional regulator